MCSLCQLSEAKNNFGQILTFWGLLYRPAFTDEGQIWCAIAHPGICLRVKFHIDRFILSPSGGEKPYFCHIFDFGIQWCRQLAAIWQSWARVHNYKPSPIQRCQNRFCTPTRSWRNREHKLWRPKAWRTDKQTDKQTNRRKTRRFWPPRRRVKSEPHHTWHGDRGPRARSCASKTFGVWRILSPLGSAENLGITRLCQIKTPITP